ncbi:COQ7-domain-containing protein [Ramicandelaber brevisporus]|nr:COQ7-domain-containing protein [Ramicandelaber brevisporus]
MLSKQVISTSARSLSVTPATAASRVRQVNGSRVLLSTSATRFDHSSPPPAHSQQPQQQQPSPSKPSRQLTEAELELIRPMLRVDQAGEVGANFIYMGQHFVLSRTRPELSGLIQHMWDQEKHHLRTFDHLIADYRARPSALRPVWELAGFVVGAGTALIGKEAAMACTEAVETVIGNHYNEQLRELMHVDHEKVKELRDVIKQFRDDELEHLDTAVEHDAQKAPAHPVLTEVIKQGCKAAIWIASRV